MIKNKHLDKILDKMSVRLKNNCYYLTKIILRNTLQGKNTHLKVNGKKVIITRNK